jgi:hypothetical protein
VPGDQDDPGGQLGPDLLGGGQAIGRWHLQVQHRDVGSQLAGQPYRIGRGGRLRHDYKVVFQLQQGGQGAP